MRNKFDGDYVIGYAMGYHGDAFKGEYHESLSTAQELIKYKNGYKDGLGMRVKESLISRGYEA